MLDRLTYETMLPLVGTSFLADTGDGQRVELRVTEVSKVMESQAARLNRTPFSVFFLEPLSRLLPQRIYLMQHDALPESLSMFLVPVGQQANGYVYEAVFT